MTEAEDDPGGMLIGEQDVSRVMDQFDGPPRNLLQAHDAVGFDQRVVIGQGNFFNRGHLDKLKTERAHEGLALGDIGQKVYFGERLDVAIGRAAHERITLGTRLGSAATAGLLARPE